MNFQAAVTTIACIHMVRGTPLAWLDRLVDDTPVAVDAETGGVGDDIRLLLKSGQSVEVQVKKGLRAGSDLWEALTKLANGIAGGAVHFGILVVSPTSSATITKDLAEAVVRMGDGRTDDLSALAKELRKRLQGEGRDVATICSKLRIQTVHALAADQASVLAGKAELAHFCSDQSAVGMAWSILEQDCARLIEQRGRRDVAAVLQVLTTAGVAIAGSSRGSPIELLEKLAGWSIATHESFTILGIAKPLKIDEAWIRIKATVRQHVEAENLSLGEALAQYQSWENRSSKTKARVIDPETLGRFVARAVLVAGPGMGKTTLLKRIARRYSEDKIPVLRVRLSAVATRIRTGATFEEAVFDLGLDGSGISTEDARKARFPNWLLLCDGLDECGALQEDVAEGIARFAVGHPNSRILVTTRPIGYRSVHFASWRHYDIPALDPFEAHFNASRIAEAAAPFGEKVHESVESVFRIRFGEESTAVKICRTPLLLGLAVAIVLRGSILAASREKLLEQIFSLVDDAPNTRIPVPPAPTIVLRRFLDILGWQITMQPLATIRDLVDRCALVMADDLGLTKIASSAECERLLAYWQEVGIVERVGDGEEQALTFIHKSFGEFTAARFLRSLPTPEQRTALARFAGTSGWTEVLRLAGMLGMANTVVEQLLATSGDKPSADMTAFSLELIARGNPPPGADCRRRVISRAFEIAEGARRASALAVASPFVEAARRFPNEIGPQAQMLLDTQESWTRLVGWACAVAAGPQHYGLSALIASLREIVQTTYPSIRASLSGGIILDQNTGSEILYTLLFDACEQIIERAPGDIADAIVPEILNSDRLDNVRFLSKMAEMLKRKGRNYRIKAFERDGLGAFTSPAGFAEAHMQMYDSIFEAFGLEIGAVPDGEVHEAPPRVLLLVSAFVTASQMHEVVVGDVWGWTRPFDKKAAAEILQGFIVISGLDRDRLLEDLNYLRRYLRTEEGVKDQLLVNFLVAVDTPEPDWTRAKYLGLDKKLVEKAVYHPSQWMKLIAGNLLLAILDAAELEETVRRLFEDGRRHTLWVAAGLAEELEREVAMRLLSARLSGSPVPGCEYLLKLLANLAPAWSTELLTVIECGLFAEDADVAVAAAVLADKMAGPENLELQQTLQQAYRHWLDHEEPYPTSGGAIPTSPRANIVSALQKIRPAPYRDVVAYLIDARSDVHDVALPMLIELLREDALARRMFFEGIGRGDLSGPLLEKVLKSGLALAASDVRSAERLLRDIRPTVRYAALQLLEGGYLNADLVRSHAKAMTSDEEQQIRDRAFRILDAVSNS